MKVGLVGFARVGKDTAVANMGGFHRAAFADSLKRMAGRMLTLALGHEVGMDDWSNPDFKEAWRPFLVALGAGMRKLQPDYWIRQLIMDLVTNNLTDMDDIAVSDVRYGNEADWIYRQKGICIRIYRTGYGPANDEERGSIQLIDQMWPGMPSVTNDGLTPVELGLRCLEIVRGHRP